jgi:hypothetical protein
MIKGVIPNLNPVDRNVIDDYKNGFSTKTDKELAEAYFKQQKMGITGVRTQMLYLIALREILIERFGDNPIEYDGMVLEL